MKNFFLIFYIFTTTLHAQQFSEENKIDSIHVTQNLWEDFNREEQLSISSRFQKIEIFPSNSIGLIQSVQSVDRSTKGTNSGAIVGSAIGQAAYIDRALKSGNSYSAKSHLGIGLLGALIGSALDERPEQHYIFNYGIKTLDGQIREIRVSSKEEFTQPIGQCVSLPELTRVSALMCSENKIQFLKRISAIAGAPADTLISREYSDLQVKCNVPGIGVMTLDKNSCTQLNGEIEK